MDEARLEIPPAAMADVLRLEDELGVSHAVAQILVRRGLADPGAARAWLAADTRHDETSFGGMDEAVETIMRHVRSGGRIVVHGDYDVDGVSSTAIVVRALRSLGADPGWFLPSRTEDGYGLNLATVERLAGQGTALLITVDCAITAVEEVAAARAAGVDVVVTDHHAPRADGTLPDAPIVHPRVGGYPCSDLCAASIAWLLSRALLRAGGRDPAEADIDLDLVALATVADCVPLVGENRRLVREGLRALAATRRPGLRALLAVARADPSAVDARTCGFRLAPRINAAGRLHRADAGLELLLTEDPERAAALAEDLDRANADRRHVETRILFEAEAQVAEHSAGGVPAAFVLAGVGWHPGVVGIVASRIAERHNRPAVLIALPEDGSDPTHPPPTASGSGRSIPGYDLLAGLHAGAGHLVRHGGHRAAAGLTIDPARVDAFRAAFVAHAAAALTPEDLVRRERADAVVAGDELGIDLAEELDALAPFGEGNPEPSLLVPAARLLDARPMGEGKHMRFTVESGGARARAVAFGTARLPDGAQEGAYDATFGLELNEWNGTVEPRLVLRRLVACAPEPIALVGEPADPVDAALAEIARDPAAVGDFGSPGVHDSPIGVRDRRGGGIAGTLTALVATGEPVLVVSADARARRRALSGRLGGFAICSWEALACDPTLAAPYAHVVALDPPGEPGHAVALDVARTGRMAHLAWGSAELAFAEHVLRRDLDLRAPLRDLYRALRDADAGARGLHDVLADRPPLQSGRALRVLHELGLVELDERAFRVVASPQRTELERSEAFRACQRRLEEGQSWLLSRATAPLAA